MWTLNGVTHNIQPYMQGSVVIDAATQLGQDIPRFCYHEGLKIAGNCRMCLIEDTKSAKPIVSCAMSLTSGLEIFTNTVRVKKARESVMEFLLINHPLDCPICDQGGECDLQDLSVIYGSDNGRFYEYKRNVEDKNCGSIIKTVMNRCILCTRCVRFATDIGGFNALGTTGRGVKSEIGSYVEKIIDTELSGNLIDICPVGALTSKPYAFAARPWELKRLTTLNVLDDETQVVRADIKDNELLRIMPAKNNRIINNWITNRARFSYEGLNRARTVIPLVIGKPLDWISAVNMLIRILLTLKKDNKTFINSSFIFSNTSSNEDIITAKKLTVNIAALSSNHNIKYTLNDSYADVQRAKAIWAIGVSVEYSAPILHLQCKQKGTLIVSCGPSNINSNLYITSDSQLLISALRYKTWHSVISPDKYVLVPNNSLIAGRAKKSIKLYESAAERGLDVFSCSSTHFQNNNLINSLLSYSLEHNNLTPNKPLSVKQTTHLPNNVENTIYLPVASIFEQSKRSYYDSSYNIKYTTRIITNSFKSNNSVLKVLNNALSLSPKNNNDLSSIRPFTAASRLDFTNYLSRPYVMINIVFSRTRANYYKKYALTSYSPTLRYTNKNLNIYK